MRHDIETMQNSLSKKSRDTNNNHTDTVLSNSENLKLPSFFVNNSKMHSTAYLVY